MKKLYAAKAGNAQNNYQESNVIEIIESTFLIDGYSVGDRLLEDVGFEVSFSPKTEKVTKVVVEKDSEDYFEDLNTKKWIKEVKDYASRILETGDEVDIPLHLKNKYYKNGRNVSYII